MHRIILVIFFFCSLNVFAQDPPDRYSCYSNRKVEISATRDTIKHPWRDVGDMSIIFDYDKKKIFIYAKETLTLTIGKLGPHYEYPEGDGNAVDMEAVDHRGLKCRVTFIAFEDKAGKKSHTLIVAYKEVYGEYRMKKLN